jgi:hypothetical protein
MIEVWKILTWLIPIIGIPGIIALVLIYPSIMAGIGRTIMQILGWVLSSRIGCAILAAVLAAFLADYHRHSKDDAEFAQRTALFEHAQTERDTRIRTETRDDVWKEIADATAENAVLENDVKEFTDAKPPIPALASDPYSIDPVSRAKLCDIAGKIDCGPRRAQGVQAPRRSGPHAGNRRLPQGVSSGARRPAQGK